jgi:sugar lactone lactonase YvrE
MPRSLLLLCVLGAVQPTLAKAARLEAQYPEVDSARVARDALRQAAPLARQKEWAAARDQARRAFAAWPRQPYYVTVYASLSARLADTAETLRALTYLADLGLSLDVASDSDFVLVRDAPALRPLLRRLAANAAPSAKSSVAATLAQDDFYPEGMSHDSAHGVWYVASVRHRKVTRVTRSGAADDFVKEGQDSLWAVLGVRADPASATLWVTTAAIPQMVGYVQADSGRSGIVAFDLATGRLKARYLLPPSAPGHLLGDLVVAPNGDVYATDSQDPAIWRILKGSDRVQEFLRHPLFRSLQGPAVHPSGRTLYVADYSYGVLAVDLNTREVRALPTPPRTTALGIDGMVWYDGGLIGVQNGVSPARIVRLALDPDGRRITAIDLLDRHGLATEPTIGTVWGKRFFYVANSQWDEYDDLGRLKPGAKLEPPHILELKLP